MAGFGIGILLRWRKQPPTTPKISNEYDELANRQQLSRIARQIPQQGWHPEEKQHRRRETRYWFASILLTLSAGIGAFVSARYAYQAAQEAHAQVLASQDANMMNAESGRAWISIVDISLQNTLQISEGITLHISFQNVGKDPALKTRSEVSVQLFPANEIRNILTWNNPNVNNCASANKMSGGHVIFPSGNLGARGETVSMTSDQIQFWNDGRTFQFPSSVDMGKEITSGRYIVFINGCMIYKSSGKDRYTRFCIYINPEVGKSLDQWAYRDCPNGNEAD